MSLLLKFHKRDSKLGVTGATLQALAERLGLDHAEVVHLALARMARTELPAYEPDDGPLSKRALNDLRRVVRPGLPQTKVLSKKSLF